MVEGDTDRRTYRDRVATMSIGGAAFDLTEPRQLKLTVDDLVLLDRHWHDDDHHSTELVDGRIYFTPARYIPRCQIAQEIWIRLREAAVIVAPQLLVGTRSSIKISPYDLPLPDIVLTSKGHGDGFVPVTSVPLAQTALDFYMGEKMQLYAKGNIPEYWVVDTESCIIHQFWQPSDQHFQRRQTLDFGNPIAAKCIANLVIQTDLLE